VTQGLGRGTGVLQDTGRLAMKISGKIESAPVTGTTRFVLETTADVELMGSNMVSSPLNIVIYPFKHGDLLPINNGDFRIVSKMIR